MLALVEVQQRRGLVAVDPEAVADDVLGVVGPSRPFSRSTNSSSGTLNSSTASRLEATALEHVIAAPGLVDRARETVQDEARGDVGVLQPVIDQIVGEAGRDQVSPASR